MEFIKELKRLGLKDKESAVYLACLELGPATAQQISRKSKVVRATTYVELESLMQMGLITKFKEGKKTLFSAEPPRQLMRLLEKRQEELQEKQHDLEQLLPDLQMLMKVEGEKPSVRYFEGKEGLHAIRQEIMKHTQPGHTIYNFTPVDYLDAIFPDDERNYYRQRIAKGISSVTIFTTRSPRTKKDLLTVPKKENTLRAFVQPDLFPGVSGFTIYEDRIAIGTFVGKLVGVVVESESMSSTMKALFNLAWIGAEKVGEIATTSKG